MDIYSRRGEMAARIAKEAIDELNKKHKGKAEFLLFSDDVAAPFDGVIKKEGRLSVAFEIRTRNHDVKNGKIQYRGYKEYDTLLITKNKLDTCVDLSKQLYLPFCLIIRFNNVILSWNISDRHGKWLIDPEVAKTATSKTINGGRAKRENYFIKLSDSHAI
jgi:hypothetical protein